MDKKITEMGHKAIKEKSLAERKTKQVMHIGSLEEARSDEVLEFCVEQLRQGKTYNELRLMLGRGPASHDKVWRAVRECLSEMILPATEEEALLSDLARTSHILRRMEEYADEYDKRARELRGAENEHHILKLKLEALKEMNNAYSKRAELYLKMKDIQKKEKRKTGTTIIFQNNYKIKRPGDAIDVTESVKKLQDGLDE